MTRRGAGDGSVFGRADGRWCAHTTVDIGRRRYIYGPTRQEVRRKLAIAVQKPRRGDADTSREGDRRQSSQRMAGGSALPVAPADLAALPAVRRLHTLPTAFITSTVFDILSRGATRQLVS